MLDINFIRENKERVKRAIIDKSLPPRVNPEVVDRILELNDKRRNLIKQVEDIRRERNQLADRLKTTRTPADIQLGKDLKDKLSDLEPELARTQDDMDSLILSVPNVYHESVPIGKDATANKTVKTWGEKPKFGFAPKDHIQLGKDLDILDLERGAKVAGFRGYFLKNEAVLMQLGLMRYGLDKLKSKGFKLMIPPIINLPRCFTNTGHFPWGEVDVYKTWDDREETEIRNLAGTAEVPIVSYHQDETLNESQLPLKYAGFSPCFRREIGSYGKDTKGIYRIHEFMKIEQVIIDIADEKNSLQQLEELVKISEEILQELKLPYRVVSMCTADMGEPQFKKYDLETWMPSRNDYGETHSASAMLDFQSRRANIKYRTKNGETKFVHMLNNTMIASPRLMIALWENHQQKDGSIKIPQILVPYVGVDKIE